MAALNRNAWKAHEEAEALLSLDRTLTDDEIEQVLRDWTPAARHNIGATGTFFTPPQLAHDLAILSNLGDGGRYLDLCAGSGRLTWALRRLHRWDSPRVKARTSYTCVEIEAEFCEVGRKLMPWAEWVCGSAFEQEVIAPLGTFDVGVSNPPFGRVRTRQGSGGWLRYAGAADLQACEVLARSCTHGGHVILPQSSVPWLRSGQPQHSQAYADWTRCNGPWMLERTSLDSRLYAFDGTAVNYDIAELMRQEDQEGEWGPLYERSAA